jgi:hypothetical protein
MSQGFSVHHLTPLETLEGGLRHPRARRQCSFRVRPPVVERPVESPCEPRRPQRTEPVTTFAHPVAQCDHLLIGYDRCIIHRSPRVHTASVQALREALIAIREGLIEQRRPREVQSGLDRIELRRSKLGVAGTIRRRKLHDRSDGFGGFDFQS